MAERRDWTCTRYEEDKLNIGAGAGLCYCPDNGFDKTVPKCADKIRQGTCPKGYRSPYAGNRGGRS